MKEKFIACILALVMGGSLCLSACALAKPTNPSTPPEISTDGGNGEGQTDDKEKDPPKTDEDDTKPDDTKPDDTKPDDTKPDEGDKDPTPEEQNGIVITANEATISAGKYFDPFEGVTARDKNGNDITAGMTVSGDVNTSKEGEYFLKYTATDGEGHKGVKTRKITVTKNEELGKTAPVFIYTSDEPYNIARGCYAVASSVHDSGSAAEKAVDGKENTRWESVHGVDSVDFTVDLGAILPLESLVIVWENAYATRFDLSVSDDGEGFQPVAHAQNFGKGGERTYQTQLSGRAARYVRLHCAERATGYGYSIYEFQVFGKRGTVIPMEKYPILLDAENSSSPDWKISDEQWLIADMGATKTVDRVEISWKDGLSPAERDFEISTNGSDYTPVQCDGGGYIIENNVRTSKAARYFRINMHSRRFYMNAYRITQLTLYSGGQRLDGVKLSASTAGSGHPASDALENYATYWESAHDASPQTVDLGKISPVGRVDLFWRGDDGRKGKYYDLQISTDGENFTTVFRQTHGGTEEQSVYVFENARYLRILDYQSTDKTRFMLEGIKVHSQYPNEQKVDYDTDIAFPAYEEVKTQNGSYLTGGTDFPTAKLVTYLDESLRDKPIPSNDWWQSLLINDKGHNMYMNPLVAKFDANGLWLTSPGDGYYSGDYPGNGRQTIDVDVHDLRIGYAGTGRENFVKVVDYSDYSVACVMSDTDGVDKKTAYLSQGTLYGYFFFAEPQGIAVYSENLVAAFDLNGNRILSDGKPYTGDCIVVCVRTHASYESDIEKGHAKTYEERFYVLSAPENTTFLLSDSTVKISMKEGNFLSVGAMSTVNTVSETQAKENTVHGAMNKTEAQLLHGHGYAFVVQTRCEMQFDGAENLVKTRYISQVCNVRGEAEAYTAFLPHQYKKSADNLAENYFYPTVHGDCRAQVGNIFETSDRFYGIVPQFTSGGTMSEETLLDLINILYKNMGGDKPAKDCDLISGDPYWQGKNLHPMAMAALAASEIGAFELRDGFLDKIEYVLEDWFNYTPGKEPHDAYFYYDSEWGTLYYKNSEFGAGVNLADHHFTYGYYTFAAGVLSAYRPAFAQKYGDMIELLIRDYMNWERDDDDFPFMRNYDVFAGHGWAGGYADNDGGNNQESAGEALNSWVGAYLYATTVGNDVIRETAICGFTTELGAIKQYWFNYDGDSFAEFYPYGALGQLYGASNFFGTFFNGEPLYAYGIHLIPGEEFLTSYAIGEKEQATLKGVMDALKRDQASWNFADAESKTLHAWQHIFISITACYDPAAAIKWYDELMESRGNIGNDNEQFNVYYMIHALEGLGGRTADIWAVDGASATVYKKDGAYTAVIWNPTTQEVKYVFRDRDGEVGYAIVPAQSLVSCDPRKETSSFAALQSADALSVGDFYESENLAEGAGLTFKENGSATYALTFGTAAVYRRAIIRATGEVRLFIDGEEYPLTKTEKGYESAPISLTLRHIAVLQGSNATVEAFTFGQLELQKLSAKLTATASSENGDNKASKAVDGSTSTRWESVQKRDGEYLLIELSEASAIYSMTIQWEAASAKEYTVSFSAGGKEDDDFTEVYHGFSTQGARTDTIMPSAIMEVKYIKIYGISRTTEYGYSIFEVNIFGL